MKDAIVVTHVDGEGSPVCGFEITKTGLGAPLENISGEAREVHKLSEVVLDFDNGLREESYTSDPAEAARRFLEESH